VSTDDEWRAVVGELRAEEAPYQSPAFARLHAMAEGDARGLLAGFVRQGKLDEARIHDLVGDWLLRDGRLDALLASDQGRPRQLFATSILRTALSWIRRKAGKVVEPGAGVELGVPPPDHVFLVHARQRLSALAPRDRDVIVAVHAGEDREALARYYGISRAAIDQIVSRARRTLGAE
jgi:DNA-directed RNA polymerase specialized sigma24 family protein